MRTVVAAAAAVVLAVCGVTTPASAASGAAESTWSDAPSSSTLVTESECKSVSGPSPYNWQCKWTAVADTTLDAVPKRGMCTEVLVTAGSRVIGGPCGAKFSVTMKVHRAVVDRVLTCNGTSVNQETVGPEPVQVKGNFEYESTDGLRRTVSVDVNVTNNVVSFAGSVLAADQNRVLDEVHGSFKVHCGNGTRTDGAWRGDYAFVA